jgi:hypothetical protein
MSNTLHAGMGRRRVLKLAGTAAAGAVAWGRFPRATAADDLRPSDPVSASPSTRRSSIAI